MKVDGAIQIRRASDGDISAILKWLKREEDVCGYSFFCNKNDIEKAHSNGTVIVLRKNKTVLAFSTEEILSPGTIFVVHPKYRGMGYGTVLANHCLAVAAQDDICLLKIECVPETSVPFWSKVGFRLLPCRFQNGRWLQGGYASPYAVYTFPKRFTRPVNAHDVDVSIQTCPSWSAQGNEVLPLITSQRGWLLESGEIQLENRVIIFNPSDLWDVPVKLFVDGKQVRHGRVSKSLAFGFNHCQTDGAAQPVDRMVKRPPSCYRSADQAHPSPNRMNPARFPPHPRRRHRARRLASPGRFHPGCP